MSIRTLLLPLLALLLACGHDEHNQHEGDQNQNQNQHEHEENQNQEEDNQNQHNQHNQHEHPDLPDVESLEVMTRGDAPEVLATATGDTWTGELPELTVDGAHLSVGARWFDPDGEELEIDYGHFVFQARLAEGSDEVIQIQSHGDHLHLTPGDEAGTAEVIFRMMFHGIPHWETAPLELHVVEVDG